MYVIDANLHNRFWGKAIMTATYLQNLMPSRSINKTPIELFTGKKPDISHIRIFGSKVYSFIPKQKRKKWDDKAEEGVLVGYDGNTKGYRILDPKTDRVWISRSVRIIESDDKQSNVCQNHEPVVEVSPETTNKRTISIQMDTRDHESSKINNEEINQEDEETNSSEEHKAPSPVLSVPSTLEKRKSQRTNKGIPPDRLSYKVQISHVQEPSTWNEMLKLPIRERRQWIEAAKEEMRSLNEHQVWVLSELPPGKKIISCKWVFKAKLDSEGQVHTYNARFVARGFTQCYGQDYDEIFAPVVKHETVRVLLAVAAQKKLHVRHLDVKSAYLNGDLKEEIYMEQPPGFEEQEHKNKVLRLRKSIYGLKQSARAWNIKVTEALVQLGFRRGNADPCMYTRKEEDGNITYVLIYVDDLLVAGAFAEVTENVNRELNKYFVTKDLGDVGHYLSIQVEREEDGSFLINQKAKIVKMLEEHGMLESKPIATPMEVGFLVSMADDSPKLANNSQYRQAIGSLLYIALVSRPDIAVAVSFLSRCVETPTERDWKAVKRVMRYLASTINKKLCLSSNGKTELKCFVDADWAGDKFDRKSTSGYVFVLGNSIVAWSSRKQTSVAMSSTEAEYVAASYAAKELLWLRQLLKDMSMVDTDPIIIFEDNQGCIRLIESDKCGARTKHIDVCHHQLRDLREKGVIDVHYCPSNIMLADLLTKPLAKVRFLELTKSLGLQ